MRVRVASRFAVIAAIALLPIFAHAEPKKKVYNNSADQVFNAALRTARERHVVTYVDEKTLMFAFETGRSLTSEGFVANASVEPQADNKATLIINVQTKKGFSWGAGDRMTDKFYQQVADELAGDPQQRSAIKASEKAIAVPDPKAVPAEPSMTAGPSIVPVSAVSSSSGKGSVTVNSAPDGADVYVDDNFVGNAPAVLKLSPGKHTVKVSQDGYKAWSKDISVFADSEVNLKAALSKN
jgi:hypothetical protein